MANVIDPEWEPNYQYLVDAAENRRPARLPIYEHIISPEIMGQALRVDMLPPGDDARPAELRRFYSDYVRFFRELTYDTVSFEAGIVGPWSWDDTGAILGGKKGPIQNRADFERFPFDEVDARFWRKWTPQFEAIAGVLPDGMKLIGGCGYGVFEISEDLVGYENLCLLMHDDPELFSDLYKAIGGMMVRLWTRLLREYGDLFCVCRMGDDLGYRSSTLLRPKTLIEHVLPQHKRVIDTVRAAGKPFLLHCCGNIFSIMENVIGNGINAKHSNEDQIAPFDKWIELYGNRIGLFGGIDVDALCRQHPSKTYEEVLEKGTRFRATANGYALGSGNSIPEYVPLDGYLAMIAAAQEIRKRG